VLDFYYSRFDNLRKFRRREFNRQNENIRNREDFAVTEKYLSTIIDWTKQNNANFFVVTTSHSPYSAPLSTVLRSRGVPMIEADNIFGKSNVENHSVYLFDGIHWNKTGHELIADGIENVLTELNILRKPESSTVAGVRGRQ
jgi:hypothetical protein